MEPEIPEPLAEHRGWAHRLRSLALDTRPLRQSRDFRLLFVSSAISRIGSELTFVAIPFQIFEMTGSVFAVGLIGLFELVPLFTLSLVGGAIADAMDRKKLLIAADLASAVASIALVVNAGLEDPYLAPLYALTFVHASLYALSSPALRATTPRLIRKEDLTAAAALQSAQFDLSSMVGPAIAGLLIAGFGLEITYGIDAVSFLVSAGLVVLIAPMPPMGDIEKVSFRSIFDGVRFLKGRPVLQGSFIVDLIAMIFGMSNALFPAIAARYGGASVLGLLYSAPPLGALAASLSSGWTKRVRRQGVAVYIAVILWGLALVGFALADSLWLALVMIALAGAADSISAIFRTAILQASTPPHMMGRLHGVEMTVVTSGPSLGDLEAGLLASLTSVGFAIGAGGIACVVGVGLMALLLPQFAAYDASAPPET